MNVVIRFAGFIALLLVAISLLDYFGTIEIVSSPLKIFVDALIQLGDAVKKSVDVP